jgi:hypothetical protein
VTAPDIRNYMRDTQSFTHLGGYQEAGFEFSGTGTPAAVHATAIRRSWEARFSSTVSLIR